MDISDSGIDGGTTMPGHFTLYELGDTNNASRVVYNRLEGTPNRRSTIQGCDGHGNLNAHIVCAYDDQPAGFPQTDSAGYYYDLGVCPFVRVGSSVIFDPADFTNPNYADLMSQAYNDGARISNNSWGDSETNGAYNSDSQAYDALVRDAQPVGSTFAVAGNQEMVIVFAAGTMAPVRQPSARQAPPRMSSLSVAQKTCDPCPPRMAAITSWGMTVATPRIPAPTTRTTWPRSPAAARVLMVGSSRISSHRPSTSPGERPRVFHRRRPVGLGSALPCFLTVDLSEIGICGVEGSGTASASNFFPVGQEFFTESTGTSHSTPAVSGACALLRQYFINQSLLAPSPAMTKAYLMNSARYITGSGANDTLWSNNQGMGELDLGMAFDGVPRLLQDELATNLFTASGQARTFLGTITDPTKPFRVTLAWTDPPGSTTGAALDNDLDLTVSVACNTYKGNVFKGDHSITGGSADHLNNVESVFLPAGVSGDFTVTVTADNINSDALGNGDTVDQDFALVVYNAQSITNQPNVCIFTLNSTNVNLGAQGTRSGTVSVKPCSAGCSWTAVSNDPFITIISDTNGVGNGNVRYTVPGNTNTVPLTGTMTIAGQTVMVNQAAGGCTNALSPATAKFKAAGGSKTVKVKTRFPDCVWTAVSTNSFITITAGTNGMGNGVVFYTVATNTTSGHFTGTIAIASDTFTLTQSAGP